MKKNVYNLCCSFRDVTPLNGFDMGGVLTKASRIFFGGGGRSKSFKIFVKSTL